MLKLSYVLEVFCNKNQISRFNYYNDINKSIQTKRKQCPPRAESNPLTKTPADRSRVPRPLKFLKWAQQMLGDFSFTILNFGIFWTLIQFVQSNSELKWRIQFCNMSARWPGGLNLLQKTRGRWFRIRQRHIQRLNKKTIILFYNISIL